MKHIIYVISALTLFSCMPSEKVPEEIKYQFNTACQVEEKCSDLLNRYSNTMDFGNFLSLYKLLPDIKFDYDGVEMTEDQYATCRAKKRTLDSLYRVVNNIVKHDFQDYKINVVNISDYLINSSFVKAFYGKRGETIQIQSSADNNYTLKVYNADSRKLIYNSRLVSNIEKSVDIPNSAVYLIEITCATSTYLDLKVTKDVKRVEDFLESKSVKIDTIPSHQGEFRAHKVAGVKLKNLFEEPRKITLRSQGKAFFSGSCRSIVALNLPAGTSDVMYSLRISTSDSDKNSDGEFFDKTTKRYHEIRFLGLPIYESTKSGSSLLRELLSISQPPREEEAYCDMYVFKSAVDARKFQNKENINTLKYNLDYSIVGTQSCNGRIPVTGLKTLYLGFENEKMTSSVYLWLEAISTVKTTEYFKEKYTVIKEKL